MCSKFTGEHPCRSVISIKLQSNFIEITLRHGCSPVNLLHIFRTSFTKNTYGWLLLNYTFSQLRVFQKFLSYLARCLLVYSWIFQFYDLFQELDQPLPLRIIREGTLVRQQLIFLFEKSTVRIGNCFIIFVGISSLLISFEISSQVTRMKKKAASLSTLDTI